MALSHLLRKRKRPCRVETPSPIPPPELRIATPTAQPTHPASDSTLLTPSPIRRALYPSSHHHAHSPSPSHEADLAYAGGDDYVEELDESYYADLEAHTPPSHAEEVDENNPPEEGDLLARLLRRERQYTRLQVYYEELHRRYADSKDQISHLNRQVDALAGRLERKEQRIRFLKLIVGRK